MALLTKILKLIKPGASENYSVDVWNRNSDLIDEAVGNRVIKNADIQPGKATKVTYDTKGLVTGGEQLTPDDIPALDFSKIATGRAPVLFADGKPLYGSRFVDVDENGNFVLRDDGKGDWLISVTEDGTALLTKVVTAVADNLVTEDSEAALSANQGRILNEKLGETNTKVSDIEFRATDHESRLSSAESILCGHENDIAALKEQMDNDVHPRLSNLELKIDEMSTGLSSVAQVGVNNDTAIIALQEQVGNIDVALDSIIAIQNELMGVRE